MLCMRALAFPGSSWRSGAAGVAASLLLAAPAARALSQPDGTVIPQTNHLVSVLNTEGETIDPLTDAATTPETFTPQCGLTFTLIVRGAPGDPSGLHTSFGWYNVTGTKPQLSELHEFINCSDPPGTAKTLDIKNDPAYLGGDIGFFEATPEGHDPPNCVDFNNTAGTLGYVYYSEPKYNDDNTGPNSWIHLLIMDSKKIPSSFYFGWEDLFKGGDNDFEDILVRVDGIHCSGGGDPCDTGQLGACAAGTQQCKNGTLTCVQSVQPSTEKCNAVDDDCNGQVDEGDLCAANEICDKGKCVPKCGGAEFKCSAGKVCDTNGYCVDADCQSVSCNAGQICVGGKCVGACDGVTCPYGQHCQAGACVDPCAAITCDQGYICDQGVCTLDCTCNGCSGAKVCDPATKACVDSACSGKSCGAGTHCEAGTCVDDCAGATCPAGQACVAGSCTGDADAGATGGSGGGFDGGLGAFGGTGGATGGSGGSGASSTGGTSDGGQTRPFGNTSSDSGGCGCRVAGDAGRDTSLVALAGLLAALGLARRRRR